MHSISYFIPSHGRRCIGLINVRFSYLVSPFLGYIIYHWYSIISLKKNPFLNTFHLDHFSHVHLHFQIHWFSVYNLKLSNAFPHSISIHAFIHLYCISMYFSPHPNPPSCMCPLARSALPRPLSPEQLGMLLVELEKLRREQKGGSPVLEASSLHIPSYLESPGTVQKHMVVESVSWSKCTCLLCLYTSAFSNPLSTSYDQHLAYEYKQPCLFLHYLKKKKNHPCCTQHQERMHLLYSCIF